MNPYYIFRNGWKFVGSNTWEAENQVSSLLVNVSIINLALLSGNYYNYELWKHKYLMLVNGFLKTDSKE